MKKKNISWILSVVLMITVWGCAEESNLQPEGKWELSSPSLIQMNNVVLDESTPNEQITFQWEAASSTAKYGVYYTVVVDSIDATDESNSILEVKAQDSGKSTNATLSVVDLNEALYLAGFKPGVEIPVKYTVVAKCLSKTSTDEQDITIVRYDDDNLYVSGDATEVGDNVSGAIKMKRLYNGSNEKLNQYEIHTALTANESFMIYNGRSTKAISYGLSEDGLLIKDGTPLSVDEEGIYRINIDFDAMTVSYFKIEQLGIIGDALTNGWNTDEILSYQGLGVWQSDISFVSAGGYIFRANGTWEGIIKSVSGTENTIALESFANDNSISIENFQIEEAGYYSVTLTLNADSYSINLEKAPDQRMYLMVNNTDTYELSMVGDGQFASTTYIALQTTDDLIVNTEEDGSGTSYSISELIGEGSGDKVSGSAGLMQSSSTFSVSLDQAYGFIIDINAGSLDWHYYNLKLFHWDNDADGGWDAKEEIEMTYSHPCTYSVTADLTTDFETKFFSPWDIQYGAGSSDDAAALSGTMINDSGALNFSNISSSGTYTVTIVVDEDFATATYNFEIQ